MTPKEVRAARRTLQLTQDQLAHVLQVTRVTVARWEIGERGVSGPVALLLKRLMQDAQKTRTGASARVRRRRKR